MHDRFFVTQRNIYGRITIRSICLVPLTPYASDLRWQTRYNQDISGELGVLKHIVPLDVSGRQYTEGTFWDIVHVRHLHVMWVSLSEVISIRTQAETCGTHTVKLVCCRQVCTLSSHTVPQT